MITNNAIPLILAMVLSVFASFAQEASFCNLVRSPDAVSVVTETGKAELIPTDTKHWRVAESR